jgi:hypothetical protein
MREIEYPMSRRSLPSTLALYLIAVLVPFGLATVGLIWLVSGAEGLTTQPDRPKTLLDMRIETAREIRQALATPIPPPEPLGPITAKPANTMGGPSKMASSPRLKLSKEAREAFASELGSSLAVPSYDSRSERPAVRSYDRHTTNY